MKLTDNACFLCGSCENITEEHVFPKWLQHRYNLWNCKLTLLNKTQINYRQLKIPCCQNCNGTHLSLIENQIRHAVSNGFSDCRTLPEIIIYQWVGKIFFGILRKELTLAVNRKDRTAGNIVPKELIESFSTLHLFLQSIREPFVFELHQPGSVLKIHLHTSEQIPNYDFQDNLIHQVAQIRMGEIGFIVAFEDRSIISESYGRYLSEINGQKLLQIQFDELYAKVLYRKSLIDYSPRYAVVKSINSSTPVTVQARSDSAVIREWDQAEFAEIFQSLLKEKYGPNAPDVEYQEPNLVTTWMNFLVNEDGSVIATLE